MPKIYIIAGETSGDLSAAAIMAALRQKYHGAVEFYGIGGAAMEAQGLRSLFPMSELSLMGLVEIVPHYRRLKKLLHRTLQDIRQCRPDMLVTVDVPEFAVRVTEQLRGEDFLKIHIVAPTVWAWRKGRAKKFARLYDKILCYFPFEPRYFANLPTEAHFIGHPIWKPSPPSSPQKVAEQKQGDGGEVRAGLLAGSRASEVRRLLPIFMETMRLLQKDIPHLRVTILTLPHLRGLVEAMTKGENVIISDGGEGGEGRFVGYDFALAASGTVALELAKSRVPFVVAYKVHWLTALALRLLLRVKYVSLPNIIADELIVGEYLQGDCRASVLSAALLQLWQDKQSTREKVEKAYAAVTKLRPPEKTKKGGRVREKTPSQFAADVLYDALEKE